jgi:hypothetical protein
MHRHVYPSIGARFQTPEQCFLRRGEGSATPKGYSNARAERREGPVHAPPQTFWDGRPDLDVGDRALVPEPVSVQLKGAW